uniref:Uncharacterized protein n=1 Tax=Mycena chlorophos TaxID=658473 RepID=A0ABQ0LA77_MYCCL|nr:predicted protein [Mycena chlorophos]
MSSKTTDRKRLFPFRNLLKELETRKDSQINPRDSSESDDAAPADKRARRISVGGSMLKPAAKPAAKPGRIIVIPRAPNVPQKTSSAPSSASSRRHTRSSSRRDVALHDDDAAKEEPAPASRRRPNRRPNLNTNTVAGPEAQRDDVAGHGKQIKDLGARLDKMEKELASMRKCIRKQSSDEEEEMGQAQVAKKRKGNQRK